MLAEITAPAMLFAQSLGNIGRQFGVRIPRISSLVFPRDMISQLSLLLLIFDAAPPVIDLV